ncbi:polyprenyl synthetase family protein [Pedobacter sp. BS3]|uniref:polyprenyl synthetase family protein n=1 Tax=Pedobacter sp. BS3 TaxID=2567937 RepID=UPI0011EE3849|nr:polyprenyl synthetase family protein [Pedobacter sp. BS3]TZF82539.1 polyprenyl synthetase family protein [Pedobacter sp. BS3]
MCTPEQLQQLIVQQLTTIQLPAHPANLYAPINYILELGGKRIRPVLVLMATDLFGGDVNKAVKASLAIEVFHNFTLVHDDIMDNAPLRRGKATIHEKWGVNNAILSGDVMMVLSNQLLTETEPAYLKPVLDTFNATAQGVCEGQQLDMEFEQRDNVTIGEYINMIRLKTAVLLGGALKIGAIIGGADEDQANLIYQFGENLGIAFQLQDDILDVYGDPLKFGKQVGGDIIANKKTFLLLKTLEQASAEEVAQLDLLENHGNPIHKVKAVTDIYNNNSIRALTEQEMQTYIDKAFAALQAIRLPAERKQPLLQLAQQLIDRDK